ncbi:MAG: LamG-like jellyroll fold domain-containing protein [Cyanobacteria bacterium P01_F01_bin.150]
MADITYLWVRQTTTQQPTLSGVQLSLQITLQGQTQPLSIPFPTTPGLPQAGQTSVYCFPVSMLGQAIDDTAVQSFAIALSSSSSASPSYTWTPDSIWITSLNQQGQYKVLTGDPNWPSTNAFTNQQSVQSLTFVPTTAPLSSMTLMVDTVDTQLFGEGESGLSVGGSVPFTTELWINSAVGGGNSTLAVPLDFQSGSDYSLLMNAADQIIVSKTIGQDNGAMTKTAASTLTNHLAMTYDGSSLNTYLNGQLIIVQSISSQATTTSSAWQGAWLRNLFLMEFMDGYVQEVRQWNQVRTQAQIQSTSSVSNGDSGLVGYWRYSEGMLTPQSGTGPTITYFWVRQITATQPTLTGIQLALQVTVQGQSQPISIPFPATPGLPQAGQTSVYTLPASLFGQTIEQSAIQSVAIALTSTSSSLPTCSWLPQELWVTSLNSDGQYTVLTGDPNWSASTTRTFSNQQSVQTLTAVPTDAPLSSMMLTVDTVNETLFGSGESGLSFGGGAAFTLEMWVNAAVGTPDSLLAILLGTSTASNYALLMNAAGQVLLSSTIQSDDGAITTTVPSQTFNHLAVTYDGNSVVTYVNGQAIITQQMSTLSQGIWLRNLLLMEFLDGGIKEVRQWSMARTQAQIAAEMGQRMEGLGNGLVGYWWFSAGMLNPSTLVTNLDEDDDVPQFTAIASLGSSTSSASTEASSSKTTSTATTQTTVPTTDMGQQFRASASFSPQVSDLSTSSQLASKPETDEEVPQFRAIASLGSSSESSIDEQQKKSKESRKAKLFRAIASLDS